MSNPPSLYTDKSGKPASFDGSLDQVFTDFDSLKNMMSSGMAAAVSFYNNDGKIQHAFKPTMNPTVNGSESTDVLANPSNRLNGGVVPMVLPNPFRHFIALLSQTSMDYYELQKHTPITPSALPEGLNGVYFLFLAPMIVVGVFGDKYPAGTFEDVQVAFGTRGQGYEAWAACVESASSPSKVRDIQLILEHPTIRGNLASFLGQPLSDAITTKGPALCPSVSEDVYGTNAFSEMERVFSPSTVPQVTQPTQGGAAAVELQTGADKAEAETYSKGAVKLGLFNCAFAVDFETCEVKKDSFSRPLATAALTTIETSPAGSRAALFFDDVMTLCRESAKNKEDVLNPLSNLTMSVLPVAACRQLLTGSLQTVSVVDISDESQLLTIGAVDFLPQSKNSASVKQKITDEKKRSGDTSGLTKQEKVIIGNLGDLKEDSAQKILINMMAINSILTDYDQMKAQGIPSGFAQVAIHMFTYLFKFTTRDLDAWRAKTGHQMNHIPYVLYILVEKMYVAFGQFASSSVNRAVYSDPNKNLQGLLDPTDIETFLRSYKNMRMDFENKMSMDAPHTSIPTITPSWVLLDNESAVRTLNQSNAPPPPRDAARARDTRQHRPSNSSSEQRPAPEQRPAKKQRGNGQGDDSRANQNQNESPGMFVLYPGKRIEDAFNDGNPLCPDFVTMDRTCNIDGCRKAHKTKLDQIDPRQLEAWIDHVLATGTGFFNKWKRGKVPESKLKGLVGTRHMAPESG